MSSFTASSAEFKGIRKRRKDNVLFFTSDLALDLKVAQTSMNGGLEEAGGTIFGETTNITHPRQVCWGTSCAPGSANGGESRGSTYCFIRQLYAEWCCVFGRLKGKPVCEHIFYRERTEMEDETISPQWKRPSLSSRRHSERGLRRQPCLRLSFFTTLRASAGASIYVSSPPLSHTLCLTLCLTLSHRLSLSLWSASLSRDKGWWKTRHVLNLYS